MEEKVKNVIRTARQAVKEKIKDLKEHPLFSAGEDFYTINYKDKDHSNTKTKDQ